ncbi:hypothetical protein TSUD_36910 [Trifolium subterraneum]|uniref:Disease resistance R13L4/SHOC-2-like LRR domain-containing protein n=1 Tax=Trifolium subterraneum TaxID=3900 RepID=A0A2Z6LIF0_TRISU|nr:hypothetical protein TSUD_36910 [Trifolium subterraneum]
MAESVVWGFLSPVVETLIRCTTMDEYHRLLDDDIVEHIEWIERELRSMPTTYGKQEAEWERQLGDVASDAMIDLAGRRSGVLKWTYLRSLPSSVSKLLKLQTLDLKHTYIETLPSSIWKMELRHLFLNEVFQCKFPPQPKLRNSLSNLQTLSGLCIDVEAPVKNGLDKLVNIKKLRLVCQSLSLNQEEAMIHQLEAVADWITTLEHLQSLRQTSINGFGKPLNLHLKSFENNINLTNMYLGGRLSSSSVLLSQFPQSLVKLTLAFSKLAIDPMITLKDFPNLQKLCLHGKSYTGTTMVCKSQSFPKLLVFKFCNLKNLEAWKIDPGALPSLQSLEIIFCPRLQMLPDGLKHVNTLLELKHKNLLRKLHRWIRNFIWSGHVSTRKTCTVAWSMVCRPYDEGGLALRLVSHINDSLMLHLCWKLFSSKDHWAVMCRARFLKFGLPTRTYLKSSIWHDIKQHVHTVKENSRWLIGSGNSVAFWLDNWLEEPLVDLFNFPTSSYHHLTARVSSFIENGEWKIPASFAQQDATLLTRIHQIMLPKQSLEDILVWCGSTDGSLSAKLAYEHLNQAQQPVGNLCADKLANLGHAFDQMEWWNSLPAPLRDDFLLDKLGIPY